ncbi:MAG: glycosyltransferase, partial [Sulfurovaceae bacterium]|nr:glycosyltransferase [Sulfurovaceae bacterium]
MINKKKIFFLIHQMSAGGATRIILNLVNNLDKEIFNIHLVVFNNKGTLLKEVRKDVTIHNLNSSRVLLGTHKLIYLLIQEKPKIVFTNITHVNLTIAMWIPFLKRTLKDTKFITREVSIPTLRAKYMKTSKKIDFLYKKLISRFDVIIAQSHYMKNNLSNYYNLDSKRVTVVNNPLDLKSINKKLMESNNNEIISKDRINIIAVGMLRKEKAFERLLQVFYLLDDRYCLYIIGEGVQRKMLEENIKKLKIENRVKLLGLKENPYIYMKESKLLLLSSLYEGFPNVILEANACGTFVIANSCAGVGSEIIQNGVNGYLVEENNIDEFAEAIKHYSHIDYDRDKVKKTTERYNVENIANIYKDIFLNGEKNMKIIYLVNKITKTSVPWRWAEYFNKKSKINKIDILDIKLFIKNLKNCKKEAHIVHGHHIKAMSIFLLLNKRLKIKSIYTVHGSYLFLSRGNALLLKFIFKLSDKIIFVNKTLYSVLPKSYKDIIKDKYEIILNGVEVDYQYKKVDIYQKFNIDRTDKILFHPARFVEEKNHIRMISALKPLLDRDKKLKLILAGSGKLEDNIKLHIKKLNLSDSVLLIGTIERDEVYNFLEKCEIFLMPSISEGLNIAFLEAI